MKLKETAFRYGKEKNNQEFKRQENAKRNERNILRGEMKSERNKLGIDRAMLQNIVKLRVKRKETNKKETKNEIFFPLQNYLQKSYMPKKI